MCGIAGWIDYENDVSENTSILNKMSQSLAKRGPDANGFHKERHACLMHRRLIVIDPENGKQPMRIAYNDEDYTIVYNGELYNTDEIKNELISLGYTFKGHSDTEVLLVSFIHWREKCVEKLNGIFAFAVWDTKAQTLFLARDRMGVKPLFFYNYNNGIIFASEIKTLLCNPLIAHQIDEEGLMELFFIGPGRTPGNGIIRGVKELKPGEYAYFSKNNGLILKKYWSLKAQEFTDNFNVAVEKTRYLVTDAVERQLVSDVPLCCFLSGGLDSSIISKVAANYYERNGRGKLSTYSVDYVDNLKYFKKSVFQPNSDEEYIKIMLDDIKSSHNYVVLDNESLVQALNEATIARDLPGMADIDSSLLLFCREIKKKFTVALSGECSDEIFAGYPWYHNKEILFDDTFPWSRSLNIRKKILRKDFIKNADEYVRQRYLDTVAQTDKLPRESKLNSRMREMFMLNVKWFMQTLLDDKNTKENNLFRLAIQVSKIKLYKIKVSTETCLLLFLYLNFIISKIKNKKMKGDIIVSTYNFFCKVS
ncbi:asparagine synthetase [Clostridium sp. CAG:557]|nr:asparagine synthetase [Clostridium sp. CAG:557]